MAPASATGPPAGVAPAFVPPVPLRASSSFCGARSRVGPRSLRPTSRPATAAAGASRGQCPEARLRPGRPGRSGTGGYGGGGDAGVGFVDGGDASDAALTVPGAAAAGAPPWTDEDAASSSRVGGAHEAAGNGRIDEDAGGEEEDGVEAVGFDDDDAADGDVAWTVGDGADGDAVAAATAAADAWATDVDDYPPAGYTDGLASATPSPVSSRDTDTNNTPPPAVDAPVDPHYGSRLRTSSRGIEECVLVGVDILRRSGLAARYGGGSGSTSRLAIEASLAELGRLAETAGMAVVGSTYQRLNAPLTGSYIGSGKVAEVRSLLTSTGACTAIFDDELSPAQQRTLEAGFGGEAGGIKVLDRTALILDIFAQHAGSREGALQTELALYQYRLPRLTRMWTHLERQSGAGGVGLRGPGETQLEVDRRLIGERVARLRRSIERLRAHRGRAREKRRKGGLMVVALVGYTNAGKSSLMEGLTAAEGGVADQLFATLDPTTRKARLAGVGGAEGDANGASAAAAANGEGASDAAHSGVEVLVTDTVGFIQKLPTQLAAAFTATLEEVTAADVIVHVVDGSLGREVRGVQIAAVNTILAELGAADKPTVIVLNKTDLLTGGADGGGDGPAALAAGDDGGVGEAAAPALAGGGVDPIAALVAEVTEDVAASMPRLLPDGGDEGDGEAAALPPPPLPQVVAISALSGAGMADLSTTLAAVLRSVLRPVAARIPYTHGELVAAVHDRGTVETTDYGPDGTYVEARVPPDVYARLTPFLVLLPGEEPAPEVVEEEDWAAIAKKRA